MSCSKVVLPSSASYVGFLHRAYFRQRPKLYIEQSVIPKTGVLYGVEITAILETNTYAAVHNTKNSVTSHDQSWIISKADIGSIPNSLTS